MQDDRLSVEDIAEFAAVFDLLAQFDAEDRAQETQNGSSFTD